MQKLLTNSKNAIKRAAFVYDIIESKNALIGFYETGNISLFIHKTKSGLEFSIIKNRTHIYPQTIQKLESKKSQEHKEQSPLHEIANTFTQAYKNKKNDPQSDHIIEQITTALA